MHAGADTCTSTVSTHTETAVDKELCILWGVVTGLHTEMNDRHRPGLSHATARSVRGNAEARKSEQHPSRSLVSCHMLLEASSRGYQSRTEIGQHGIYG